MPVLYGDHIPLGCHVVGLNRLRHHHAGITTDLQVIAIDHDKEVIQPILNREAAGFGNLSLLLLAITHEYYRAALAFPESLREGHPVPAERP